MLDNVAYIIEHAVKADVPLVLDGDALWLLSQRWYAEHPSRLRDYPKCVLTPNAMEFRRLWVNYVLNKDVLQYFKPKQQPAAFSSHSDESDEDETKENGWPPAAL